MTDQVLREEGSSRSAGGADDSTEEPPTPPVVDGPSRPVPTPVDPREITESPQTDRDTHVPAGLDGAPGSSTLAAFLRFHPFMAFFCWLADAQYPAHHIAEVRVAKHRVNSPKLYWICVGLDMVVTLVAVALTLVIAAAVAYKAVWV